DRKSTRLNSSHRQISYAVFCLKRKLDLAEQYKVESIAFPSLSTGIYGYPLDLAAPIALRTIIEHIKKPTSLKQVMVVLFGDRSYQAFDDSLTKSPSTTISTLSLHDALPI